MALHRRIRHWFKAAGNGRFVETVFGRRHPGTTIEQDNARQVAEREAARRAMRSPESRRVDPR